MFSFRASKHKECQPDLSVSDQDLNPNPLHVKLDKDILKEDSADSSK